MYRRYGFFAAGSSTILLNCLANMRGEALLKVGLEQHTPHTCSRSPRRDILVGIAGNENNRCSYVALSQTPHQIDAVYLGHLVVDHKAVDAGRTDCVKQRGAAPEGSNFESVRFQKKSQGTENTGVVVDHIDCRLYGWLHHEDPRI